MSLNLEILKGGEGCSSSFGNPGGREGGPKICLPSGGGWCGFFLDPFNIFLFHLRFKRNGKQLNVSYWVTEALHRFATYNISSHEAIT